MANTLGEQQISAVPRAMSDQPLPAPEPPNTDMMTLVTMALEKKFDPDLLARFANPEAMAAAAHRESEQRATDWPALARYRAANASRTETPELIMIGDSITEIWQVADPGLFSGTVLNRGISGQTSAQILLRFYPDVVDLQPRRVHILCGTNDVAGNSGPNTPDDYKRNIRTLVDLAQANGVEVLLGSVTPAATIFWSADAQPLHYIPLLNAWLRRLAAERELRFIDYYAALADDAGALRDEYSSDGVHVTRAGYRVMRALLDEAMT
jgi:lysophospholipase L1-like esterase